MNEKSFIALELDLIEDKPHLFTSLEINGVKEVVADDGLPKYRVDNDNPEFYSIYAREVDGTCMVCADASTDRLDELRKIARQGVERHGWDVKDFTGKDKPLGMSIRLVTLTTGDVGLVVNGTIILTADPNFEPPRQVVLAARNLAIALSVDLQEVNIHTPAKEDWNWDDVIAQLIV